MKKISCFSTENLQALCDILGDTQTGLTGSEISDVLSKCNIEDIDSRNTKRIRLYNALANEQHIKQCGNHVIAVIHKTMNPVLFSNNPKHYELKRDELNKVLAFSGLTLGEDGKIRIIPKATTLKEAEERASRLKKELISRNVHNDVLRFCKAELLEKNYFHAVLEATKSIANKIRNLSGLTNDGAPLATKAFSLGLNNRPILAINSLQTDTETSEQKGFMNLLIGLFGTFRNPTAHAEKIYWEINEQDALDILSLASLIHRKLDNTLRPQP